jgi:type IV secretion system protein VirD4
MLSRENYKKARKRRIKLYIFFILFSNLIIPYISLFLDHFFTNRFDYRSINISYFESFVSLFSNKKQFYFFLIFNSLVILIILYLNYLSVSLKAKSTKTIKVTDKIEIPVAVGQGQHGSSRFLTESEKDKYFSYILYDPKEQLISDKNLGLVFGMERIGRKEKIFCIIKDMNSLILGATRSGKTRRIVFETIFLRSLCNKSMVILDLKGELFFATHKYLREKGYEVIDLDFRNPNKSKKYNFMQKINDAVREGDIPKAIDYTWDLVSVMVGVPKGEPLWTNGECSVIAAVILLISMEAPEEYKNLPNVYAFIANMCKQDEFGTMLITKYFDSLKDSHPAKMLFDVAEISPEKMRGSFFGMALTTLRLFTNWNIADMTADSDFDISSIGKKKTAVFVIVHDEKSTYYPLVSLLMNQIYVSLVELATVSGGRLPVEVDMIWDEFGNFPEIPSFGSMLSAGLSRGIRFSLIIQSFQQLEKKYKEDYYNIKNNCNILVYLKSAEVKTVEELSKMTGTYTVEAFSASNSISDSKNNFNYSNSANMHSRPLLYPSEIDKIESPYSLVFYGGNYPAIMIAPDLTEYYANKLFGLGDEKYNRKLFMERDNERPVREIKQIDLWKKWDDFKPTKNDSTANPKNERISFL